MLAYLLNWLSHEIQNDNSYVGAVVISLHTSAYQTPITVKLADYTALPPTVCYPWHANIVVNATSTLWMSAHILQKCSQWFNQQQNSEIRQKCFFTQFIKQLLCLYRRWLTNKGSWQQASDHWCSAKHEDSTEQFSTTKIVSPTLPWLLVNSPTIPW